MDLRVSTYEMFLPMIGEDGKEIPGQRLLVNGLYGAMDVVDGDTAKKLRAGEFDYIGLETTEHLFARGHITRKEPAGEEADLKLLARLHRILLDTRVHPIIMPTYDCNFRCPYCFESHRLAKGQEWLDKTMSLETIESVFSSMADYRRRGCAIDECTLFGGEPLLAKNFPIVREILRRAKDMGLKISIISNGYELDSYLDTLREFPIQDIQLTVDGVGAVNDRRRLHKSGAKTYERILSNMELALSCGINMSLRINVSRENFAGIEELIADLKSRGFIGREEEKGRGIFDYYLQATNNDHAPEQNVTEREILDELCRIGYDLRTAMEHEAIYRASAYLMEGLLQKTRMPDFSPRYCGAEGGMSVIDPFGNVYACWDVVGKEDLAVGFVEDGKFFWNFNKPKWRTRTVDRMEKCRSCPFALICRGGCAFRAQQTTGDCFREYCGEIKDIFSFAASYIAGKAWRERGERELSLSLAGPLGRLTEKERQTIMASDSQKELYEIIKAAGFSLKNKEADAKAKEAN